MGLNKSGRIEESHPTRRLFLGVGAAAVVSGVLGCGGGDETTEAAIDNTPLSVETLTTSDGTIMHPDANGDYNTSIDIGLAKTAATASSAGTVETAATVSSARKSEYNIRMNKPVTSGVASVEGDTPGVTAAFSLDAGGVSGKITITVDHSISDGAQTKRAPVRITLKDFAGKEKSFVINVTVIDSSLPVAPADSPFSKLQGATLDAKSGADYFIDATGVTGEDIGYTITEFTGLPQFARRVIMQNPPGIFRINIDETVEHVQIFTITATNKYGKTLNTTFTVNFTYQ